MNALHHASRERHHEAIAAEFTDAALAALAGHEVAQHSVDLEIALWKRFNAALHALRGRPCTRTAVFGKLAHAIGHAVRDVASSHGLEPCAAAS